MTRDEAIQAMKEGKHVTHAYFSKDEWITMENHFGDWVVITEDGYGVHEDEFWKYRQGFGWEDNWSVHWTSNMNDIHISHVDELLHGGYKITHDDLKYDWIKLSDNGNILCSTSEERNPKKFFDRVLELEQFHWGWKIVE